MNCYRSYHFAAIIGTPDRLGMAGIRVFAHSQQGKSNPRSYRFISAVNYRVGVAFPLLTKTSEYRIQLGHALGKKTGFSHAVAIDDTYDETQHNENLKSQKRTL